MIDVTFVRLVWNNRRGEYYGETKYSPPFSPLVSVFLDPTTRNGPTFPLAVVFLVLSGWNVAVINGGIIHLPSSCGAQTIPDCDSPLYCYSNKESRHGWLVLCALWWSPLSSIPFLFRVAARIRVICMSNVKISCTFAFTFGQLSFNISLLFVQVMQIFINVS